MNKKNIYIITTGAKGGIDSVVKNHISSGLYNDEGFKLLVSHTDHRKVFPFLSSFFLLFLGLIKNNVSLVHAHVSYKGSVIRKTIFLCLCKIFKVKFVLHVHGSEFKKHFDKPNKLYRIVVRYLINSSDFVFVLSKSWKSYFLNNFSNKNVVVIKNFPDPIYISQRQSPTKPFNIIFLGYLGERKGVYDLLKAFGKSDVLRNSGAQLLIGGNGELDKVKKIISEENYQNIKLLGWVGTEEKKQLLLDADALTLPSYNEGLPISILEAMSSGLPVVSTFVGGIPDLLEDEETALLHSPGDIRKLQLSLERLATDEILWKKISKNSKQLFDKENSYEAINKQIIDVYKNILST